jgi:hypothetical protein
MPRQDDFGSPASDRARFRVRRLGQPPPVDSMLRTLTRNQLVTDLAIAGVFFLLFGLFAMLAGADIARTSVAFGMATALALAVE